MKTILTTFLFLVSLLSYAQELPNFKGKKFSDIITYLDSSKIEFSREDDELSKSILAKETKKYSSDSSNITFRILKLKFDKSDICIYSNYIYKTEKRINSSGVFAMFPEDNSSDLLLKAGNSGLIANTLMLGGATFAVISASFLNPEVILIGGVISLVGVGYNFYAWHNLKKAALKQKQENKR